LPACAAHVAGLAHTEVVVDEADDRHAHDQRHQGEPAREADLLGADVRDEVGDHRAADDRDAAHGGRARLRRVGVGERSVVADLLADAVAHEDADEQRRAEDAQHERNAQGDEERDHETGSVPERRTGSVGAPRACATASRPTARLPFTSTASSSPSTDRTASSAPGASATTCTSISASSFDSDTCVPTGNVNAAGVDVTDMFTAPTAEAALVTKF
jgi:hypothetical protein